MKKISAKEGQTFSLVKSSFFKKDIESLDLQYCYAAMSHFAVLYCSICSCGVMIIKDLLSLSIANMMLHTLCETAPIATSFGFASHFPR